MTVLTLGDTMHSAATKMCEGNPGAINVIMMLLKGPGGGIPEMLALDSMGIRGPMIWVGYKDICGENIEVFVKKVMDPESGFKEAILEIYP